MAEFLHAKGYEVHGIIRRASSFNTSRIDHIYRDPHEQDVNLFLHYGDLGDSEQLTNLIYNIKPDEIYHLAAQRHVRVSFDLAEYTGNITGLGTTRILETIRRSGYKIRFYQASSSEMFRSAPVPQNEEVPFHPCSSYAAAKLYAYWMTKNYRESYGLFTYNGILFNHESPRRGETFVSRKITRAIANITAEKQNKLYVGNLKARRDWGYAPEYVKSMRRRIQQERPDDYVIGTGKAHSVQEFLEKAFEYVGLNWKEYVERDPRYFRSKEVDILVADTSKVGKELHWRPNISFEELVKIMVDADMQTVGLRLIGKGNRILEEKFGNDRWFK